MPEIKLYFVTKFALSMGKVERLALEPGHDPNYLYDRRPYHDVQYVKGRNAFESHSDAVKAARAERDKKISSLKKQIAKLEELIFAEPPHA